MYARDDVSDKWLVTNNTSGYLNQHIVGTHTMGAGICTVEPVLGDHPFCPPKAVAQDRWSLITGRTQIIFYRCVH